jgi:protein-S-isoprenylcysteine O-methyltransferase Ste14
MRPVPRSPIVTNILLALLVPVLARLAGTGADTAAGAALILIFLMGLQAALTHFASGKSEAAAVPDFGRARGAIPGRRLRRVLVLRALGFAALALPVIASFLLQTKYSWGHWGLGGDVLWLLLPLCFSVTVDSLSSRPYGDEYWTLGKCVVRGRCKLTAIMRRDLGSSFIKIFFYPLMFVNAEQFLDRFETLRLPETWSAVEIYRASSVLYLLIDVVFAASAYALSLKIIDNRVRSVNPYPAAWFVTLLCYDPFWGIAELFIVFEWHANWHVWLESWHALQFLWLTLILCCFIIYAWSTVEMGPRFSNLTYRGTVSTGPYRLMKHPAYVSKVVSYWLITVPFVPIQGWAFALQQCLMLSISCSIYYFRAKFEERHLLQFAEYKAYAAGPIARSARL